MRQTRLLAFLLAITMTTSMLSGCGQTIKQHHFLTDSQTNMEYTTQYVETDALPALQELKVFCDEKGIELDVEIEVDFTDGYDNGPAPSTPSDEQIENFFDPDKGSDTYMKLYCEIDKSNSIVSFISKLDKCIAELHRVLEEHETALDDLIEAKKKDDKQVTFELSGGLIFGTAYEEDDIPDSTFYAVAELDR